MPVDHRILDHEIADITRAPSNLQKIFKGLMIIGDDVRGGDVNARKGIFGGHINEEYSPGAHVRPDGGRIHQFRQRGEHER
jgi:hypothetical protein